MSAEAIHMENTDAIASMLDSIGHLIVKEADTTSDRILLYARVEEGMLAPSLFEEHANFIQYVRPSLSRDYDVFFDLWRQQSGVHWGEIEYLLHSGSFDVRFVYPDEIDSDEDTFVRRDRVVQRYFGDKPIVYPPWDDELPSFDL
jgi:hypothetical protein